MRYLADPKFMCTVTLIPAGKNNFILTSNRDEAINRKTLPPEFYKVHDTRMLFPMDAVAGGTWIGVSDKNTMICLLNGGFEIHERAVSYRQSRGIVVKDLLGADHLETAIQNYNCNGIEPFTIVAANWQSELVLIEFVWDGQQKTHTTISTSNTYLVFVYLVYSRNEKEKRRLV